MTTRKRKSSGHHNGLGATPEIDMPKARSCPRCSKRSLGLAFLFAATPWLLRFILAKIGGDFALHVCLYYINALYPLLFTCIAFAALSWKRPEERVLVSLLYGQCSFLLMLVVVDSASLWRLAVLAFGVLYAVATTFMKRPDILATLSTPYCILGCVGFVDFAARIKFDDVDVSYKSLAFWLPLPILWVTIFVFGVLVAFRGIRKLPMELKAKRRYLDTLIRNVTGVAVICIVLGYADVYYNIAQSSRGDAFEYNDASVASQSKRSLARAFPGLPKRVYANLVKELEDKPPIGIVEFMDAYSGVKTHEPGDVKNPEIGIAWADFYEQLLIKRGLTHYRIVMDQRPTSNIQCNLYRLLLYSKGMDSGVLGDHNSGRKVFPGMQMYDLAKHGQPIVELPLYLPRTMRYTPAAPADLSLKFYQDGEDMVPEIIGNGILPIYSLGMYLSKAHNYLDSSVELVHEATGPTWLTSFLDYVYFSVVTLSTTGYGDITALHPAVQILCISEICIGWALLLTLGAFTMKGIG